MMRRILIFGLGGVLALAVGAQFFTRPSRSTGGGSKLAAIPAAGMGWESKPLPLGETEAVSTSVSDTLRFDDVVYREYHTAGATFALYAAYWGPGKMPTQLVASHTPDRCWTSAGWVCTDLRYDVKLIGENYQLRGGQGRKFTMAAGPVQHVLYWHLVGAELYDYGSRFNGMPSFWRWWRDAARQVFRAPPEQYFIRLSSDLPFEKLRGEPAFIAVMEGLEKLGLQLPMNHG